MQKNQRDAEAATKRVTKAVNGLSRGLLIHLIDEAAGVGCQDESSIESLRAEVMKLWRDGQIATDDILDFA